MQVPCRRSDLFSCGRVVLVALLLTVQPAAVISLLRATEPEEHELSVTEDESLQQDAAEPVHDILAEDGVVQSLQCIVCEAGSQEPVFEP